MNKIFYSLFFSFLSAETTEAIEDLACKEVALNKLLRLVCLQSLVSSGLKPKLLELYRRLVVQSYGYQHLLTLDNLERAGLFTLNAGHKTFATLRKLPL